MKKLIPLVLALLCLTGCAVSPYVARVGAERLDAAEAAFYLYADRTLQRELGADLSDEQVRAHIYHSALDQMATASVVRQKCAELGLTLPREAAQSIAESKEALKQQLGGSAAYLAWLRENYMTDRLYDRLQEGNYYYEVLQNYVAAQLEQDPRADELLRQFFAENYTRVRYIRLSRLDENGQPYPEEQQNALLEQGKDLLVQIWNGLDFADAMARYNDDPQMEAGPIVVSRSQTKDTDYLAGLFDLAEGECAGVYLAADGYYILQRLGIAANYYDEHLDTIFHDALDTRFSQFLQQARDEYGVAITSDYRKLDLDDLARYVH